MKKIYLILASAAMLLAIDANAQISAGLGYNLMTTTSSIASDSEDEALNGFFVEATYDFNFLNREWGRLYLQPGLRYTFAAEAESEEYSGIKAKVSLTEHYIDVPVNVKYSYDIMQGQIKAYAFAGPVFSIGLASTFKVSLDDESASTDMYDDNDYGRFDLKLGLGAGVTFLEKYNVKIGYNIGLLNRYTGNQSGSDTKLKMNTGVFYVGIGYNF